MRRLAASVLGGLLLTALLAVPSDAATSVTNGHCTDDTSVTVVVDFQELGGSTVVKCVSGLPTGSTGYDALLGAGLSPTGTLHDGPGFVCRLAGRPAATEDIPVDGGTYREDCVQTPPKSAFWSYWQASNGGSWSFSNLGATGREVIPGGYEGWSFSLNNEASSNPAPRVKPSHAVEKEEPTPTSAPSTTRPAAPPPATPTASSQEPAKRPSASTTTKASSTPRPATASPTPSAPPKPTPPAPTPSPTPSNTPSATTSQTPEPTDAQSTPAQASEAASASASGENGEAAGSGDGPSAAAPSVTAEVGSDSGVPTGTLAGVGAVGAAVMAGAFVWWRRREG